MTDEELKEKVIRHDYEFQTLTGSLKDLSKEMKELTASLKHVSILNERLISMDRDLKESFQRIHKRADEIEEEIEKKFVKYEAEMKELELVRILIKYPKLTIFMVIGLYVMTFDSVRKTKDLETYYINSLGFLKE